MNILVTGSSGFIGFHLCKKLMAEGHTVIGIDNENDYYDVSLKQLRRNELLTTSNFLFYPLDLKEKKEVEKVFLENTIDLVCHLAGQAGVRYSLENPQSYIDSNLIGFFNIIETAKESRVKKFLYASSSSVYGDHQLEKTSREDETSKPVSLYAATKKSNELIAHVYSHIYEMTTCGLRFFTVYGPYGRPDMAYFHFAENMIEEESITVYNHGEMRRDFSYIDDIVDGITTILFFTDAPVYDIVNLGKGAPDKLADFVDILQQKLDMKATIEYGQAPIVDVQRTSADISYTTQKYGRTPKVGLSEGLEEFATRFHKYKKDLGGKKK